jgi:iron complex transport system substrate-binding protein
VRRAGGRLITGGLKASGGFARVSDETIVARNPDVIIAVPHAEAKDIPGITAYLKSNPAWASTSAARAGRVYVSTDNSLLQAGTDTERVIKRVRSRYLKN